MVRRGEKSTDWVDLGLSSFPGGGDAAERGEYERSRDDEEYRDDRRRRERDLDGDERLRPPSWCSGAESYAELPDVGLRLARRRLAGDRLLEGRRLLRGDRSRLTSRLRGGELEYRLPLLILASSRG